MTHMLGAFAEFERGIIRERSIAGQTAAMMRGIHCGSQKKEAPVWSADQAIRELNMALEEEDHAPVAELVAGLTKVQQLEVTNFHKADWSAGKLLCKGTEIQKLRGLHRIIADNFEADDCKVRRLSWAAQTPS